MSGFGRGGFNNGAGDDKEILIGKVEDITHSPEKGRQRLIVREKTSMRKAVSVDLKSTEVSKVKRKETYKFEVEERFSESKYGQEKSRFTTNKYHSYLADEAPTVWDGPGADVENRWNRFGGGGGKSGTFRGGGSNSKF